jgi:hypothetical protein
MSAEFAVRVKMHLQINKCKLILMHVYVCNLHAYNLFMYYLKLSFHKNYNHQHAFFHCSSLSLQQITSLSDTVS